MSAQFNLELELVEATGDFSREDFINLGNFGLCPAWEPLAPRLTMYLAAVAAAGLRNQGEQVLIGLDDWTHRDIADGIVGVGALLATCLSHEYESFALALLKTLSCANVARLKSAPVLAAMN